MNSNKKLMPKYHRFLYPFLINILLLLILIITLTFCTGEPKVEEELEKHVIELTPLQELGKLLFFDKNLSTPAGQACADCHSPESGFANPVSTLPVSQGVIKELFGNRNDLIAAYAGFSPEFYFDTVENMYIGGQFWDGRASGLADQAKLPFLNPLEMANPDEKSVIDKIRDSEYVDFFLEIFGENSLDNIEEAFNYVAEAIAEYERSEELNKFNSKYDLYLQGLVELNDQELRGLEIFESENKGNCAACHPSQPDENGKPPLFTDHTYDNLGVPSNAEMPFYYLQPKYNPDGLNYVDLGLGITVNNPQENGKFKVPTLRNIAITGPYLHNGVFKTVRQVISFYNTRDVGPWPPPEVPENINDEELGNLGLTEQEIDDIDVFLQTLTDDYSPEAIPEK